MPIRRKATVDAKGLVFSTPDSSTPSECVLQQGLGRIGEKKKHFCTKDRLSVGRENLALISQVNSTPLSRSFFGLTVDEALIEARPNCRRNLTEVSSIAVPTSIWPSKVQPCNTNNKSLTKLNGLSMFVQPLRSSFRIWSPQNW